MTYKHLITWELTFIYNFWKQGIKSIKDSKRSNETVYRVYYFLDTGNSIS